MSPERDPGALLFWCAKCQCFAHWEVDKLHGPPRIVFTITCHGAREIVDADFAMWREVFKQPARGGFV